MRLKASVIFLCFFIFWVVVISVSWREPLLLTSILILIALIYLLFCRRNGDLLIFIVASIAGPVGEVIVSLSGLWTYHGARVFGVPYWLPLAWGITAVSIWRFINTLLVEGTDWGERGKSKW